MTPPVLTPARRPRGRTKRVAPLVYQLRTSLLGIEAEIWRRILVPAEIRLGELHDLIQAAMGWRNRHLHRFLVGPTVFSNREFDLGSKHEDESQFRLADIAPRPPSAFVYEYDFGDSWEHLVVVEGYASRDTSDVIIPLCVEGARACPPEDVGGRPGYELLLRVLADPGHEQHADMRRWVGGAFDPEAFDLGAVNARLARLAPRSRTRSR